MPSGRGVVPDEPVEDLSVMALRPDVMTEFPKLRRSVVRVRAAPGRGEPLRQLKPRVKLLVVEHTEHHGRSAAARDATGHAEIGGARRRPFGVVNAPEIVRGEHSLHVHTPCLDA